VPRRLSAVKKKQIRTMGVVDLHFHGAFGIDLMRAPEAELTRLSSKLWKYGVAAFCPTTLSVEWNDLVASVTRLGKWIRRGNFPGAIPLGIHLEGPFIHPACCGAHPRKSIRPYQFSDLVELWNVSEKALKIITLAPELLTPAQLTQLGVWARKNGVVLSMGHSQANTEQAMFAIEAGFTAVTHAWNALKFHHRNPGVLGAALGHRDIFLELIIDQQHVHPSLIRWTRSIHAKDRLCFISDCTPAANTESGSTHSFGPLKVSLSEGASRTSNGNLAGGGLVLSEAYAKWISDEAAATGEPASALVKKTIGAVSLAPLKSLGVSERVIAKKKISWRVTNESLVLDS
jgi:N-acetylglucosamine-6-phosphate deacetylase